MDSGKKSADEKKKVKNPPKAKKTKPTIVPKTEKIQKTEKNAKEILQKFGEPKDDNIKQDETENTDITVNADEGKKPERNKKSKGVSKNGFFSVPFRGSRIIGIIEKFVGVIYNAFANGLTGKIFTSYKKEEAAFENGFVKTYYAGGQKAHGYFRKGREKLSEAFERSYILGKLSDFMRCLLGTSFKLYGNCLMSFGIYTILVYFIREFVPGLESTDVDFLITGICVIVISIPFFLAKDSLAVTVGQSRIARMLFIDSFGFSEATFEVPAKKSRARTNAAIIIGMVAGLLTFFVNPMYIPISVGFLIAAVLVMVNPEIGVIITIFALPFFSFLNSPSLTLAIFVLITTFGFVIKLVRGKRVFKLELVDFVILLFGILIWLSGVITSGGNDSLDSALISCFLLLGYFLVINTMRTDKWLTRCVIALVSSASIVSVYGIYQYIAGNLNVSWIDTSYFPDIKGRVVSLFENSNVLAFYLVMIFPLALALMCKCRTRKEKFVCLCAVASIFTCVIFTFSRGAWIALIAETVLFFLIYSRKTLKYIFFACFTIPFLPFILPSGIVHRFTSIGDLADSSTFYRFYTWKGSLRAIKEYLWGGVGYGTSAFTQVYPEFAYAGIETAEHSHNLYLQILFGMGFAGLLVFAVAMFLFVQRSFGYFGNATDKQSRVMTEAALASVVGALVMGLFDYIWYSYRIFFLFWIIVAIANAYMRVGDRNMARRQTEEIQNRQNASLDIPI